MASQSQCTTDDSCEEVGFAAVVGFDKFSL